ncbi:MAG: caspase family protein [Capsulimonadaceae bacterium]|nr:caspase family protein [Capsulimonadaceae bacterium]
MLLQPIFRTFATLFAALECLAFLSQRAFAQKPPTAPILRIETGMHTGGVHAIAVDASGRYMVSASDDKTVRVWDLRSGSLVTSLRPPSGGGWQNQLCSVAISPDSSTVACGGNWQIIYVFDRASGNLIREIRGEPSEVDSLAFSPNGSLLAATFYRHGLRVHRLSDGSIVGSDTAYGADSRCVVFDPASTSEEARLATSCNDGFVRAYKLSPSGLVLRAKVTNPSGDYPSQIAYSPDSSRLAVGYLGGKPRVDVLSASDLSLLLSPTAAGWTQAVCWSADGNQLFSSVTGAIRRWSEAGRGNYIDLPTPIGVNDIHPLANGGVAFGSWHPAVGAIDANGKLTMFQAPPIATYKECGDRFRLTPDGTSVSFCFQLNGKLPAYFSIPDRALRYNPPTNAMAPPVEKADGIDVEDWLYGKHPSLNGAPLKMEDSSESPKCVAISPNKQCIALGTSWFLRCYNLDGSERWKADGDIQAVNISQDGRLVVAALGDGAIRWYRMTDGKELLALFPHADQKRWVLWTPSGYYDCSPGAEDLIGWQVNRGPDQAADFFPASRFHDRFYRPDVISWIMTTLDEKVAVRLANVEAEKTNQVADVLTTLPPVVTVVSPQTGDAITSDTVAVRYVVRTPSGEPATAIRSLVNGRPVESGSKRIQLVSTDGQADTLTVTVPHADCTVSVIAENRFAASEAATVTLHWLGTAPSPVSASERPTLYILAAGIGKAYQPPIDALTYPAKDARDFVDAMMAQKGVLYSDVRAKVILDQDATREAILKGFGWIEEQTKVNDVAMIFLSGHGVNDRKGIFYFAPVDTDVADIRGTGVRSSDIQETIQALAGKTLFFIDSCHAGNAVGTAKLKGLSNITGVINELSSAENGAIVFAASTGRQESEEDAQWANGAFTKALVEGLRGKAAVDASGRITWTSLSRYVSDRVKELTHGDQTPTTTTPNTVPDFPVAVAH